jgi:hypothetical protein
VTNPFYNAREGRLRAFWRLVLQFTISLISATLLTSMAYAAFSLFSGKGLGSGGIETLSSSLPG